MQFKSRLVSQWSRVVLIVSVVGLALVTVFQLSSNARNSSTTAPHQDVIRLETRLNQLEQRFYSMEASVRNLEQQSRIAAVNPRTVNQDEWAFLRSEIQLLQRRLMAHECALAKLDERTLAANIRTARRTAEATRDVCRENVEEPLQLP